ncbi:NADPH2 dehydrogenase chain OYE2 [Apiospora sp. TS-2023a]
MHGVAAWKRVTDSVHDATEGGGVIFAQLFAFGRSADPAVAAREGFDGVEIMAGYGYLLDSFLQDATNQREDAYGGNIENRSRLLHGVMQAVVEAVGGPERVGVRLSPWSAFQGMGMADPIPQFSDVVVKAKDLNLAFIHLIEARVSGFDDVAQEKQGQNMEFAYSLRRDGTFLAAGGTGFGVQDKTRTTSHSLPPGQILLRRKSCRYIGRLHDVSR